ncbi:MAG TPA: protein phosphatase 2C domain-containing protein [Ktedonobacteraceae bacterium]|nr:protein phosphatase 2C domain-containing protein [Ktedonobacteraceae bacterium]
MDQQNCSARKAVLRVSAAGCSDTGRVREQNEDAIALCEPSAQAMLAQLGQLYLLADGAGGHAAGEVVSSTAVETISAVYYQQIPMQEVGERTFRSSDVLQKLDASFADLDAPIVHIRRAFSVADAQIRRRASLTPAYFGMVTTCIAVVVQGTRLVIAHMGDSRAYLIHLTPTGTAAVSRLTRDHSMVEELVRAGIISPEKAHDSPSRHILIRALGCSTQHEVGPDITTCMVQAGDHLLLCCDGLWSMLTDEQMAAAVSQNTPEAACHRLIQIANQAGGEDNISAIVLSFS